MLSMFAARPTRC